MLHRKVPANKVNKLCLEARKLIDNLHPANSLLMRGLSEKPRLPSMKVKAVKGVEKALPTIMESKYLICYLIVNALKLRKYGE